ncbi:Universal stress protein [Parasponia andersonii]|uniref:Universal stress protein n=1 Tax=Parasponia andersonii TaxID=3476 RepID=A0A2P5APF5_PARAD|nr:Universal stress protein [Parasponia andersonii]
MTITKPRHSTLPTLSSQRSKSTTRPPPSAGAPAATPTPTAGARRKIGVAVDLSDESAYAVRWAVHHYIRPGDAVILLHVSPTSVLFGADWGSIDLSINDEDDVADPFRQNDGRGSETTATPTKRRAKQKLEDDFDAFTSSKAADLAKPLREAQIPYKIHIVKDHDMKERLCLEVERLGLSAVIMGSRGFGAVRRGSDGRLGSVSDYCVHHCVCPVVVVRYPEDKDDGVKDSGSGGAVDGGHGGAVLVVKDKEEGETVIKPVEKAEHLKG